MFRQLSLFLQLIGVILIIPWLILGMVLPSYANSIITTNMPARVATPATLINNVNLPTPSWWNGSCDVNNNSGSLSLGTNYRGMITCGPFPSVHPDHSVLFPKGSQVQVNEWECTELAMRYLYLAYGQHPYVADGGQVVDNYINNKVGDLFQKISNGVNGQAPQIGDIISNSTHVVVVSAEDPAVQTTGTGKITVIDENGDLNSPGKQIWTDTSWTVNSGVTGWLHPNTVVTSPNFTTIGNTLNGVYSIAADNVWAVGNYQDSSSRKTLVEHWDGSHWKANTPIPPNVGSGDNYLNGVAAFSPTNIWAVGDYLDTTGTPQTLLEHYNGSSWTATTLGGGQLTAITIVPQSNASSSEAWAVGIGNNDELITYHTTNGGVAWTPIIDTSILSQIRAVSASSSTNVWAVGTDGSGGHPLALQWTGGSKWTVMSNPNVTSGQYSGVKVISSTNVWIVGNNQSSTTTATAIQWNGSWQPLMTLPAASSSYLFGIAGLSAKNIWAVGTYFDFPTSLQNTLVYHYDGKMWSQITTPSVGKTTEALSGITINPKNGNTWTVGSGYSGSFQQTLTEFFN